MLINIVACGRNGSTLLTRLLDGYKELAVYPNELNYFRLNQNKVSNSEFFKNFFVGELKVLDQICVENLELKNYRNKSTEILWNNKKNFLENLFINYINNFDNFYQNKIDFKLIFKCTDVENLKKYQNIFPDMKFIHLIRNPVTNYESLKRSRLKHKNKTFFNNGKSILENFIEDRWKYHLDFFFYKEKLNPNNHILIKYEDLCENTENTIKKILFFFKY